MKSVVICGAVLAGETLWQAYSSASYGTFVEYWSSSALGLLAIVPAACKFSSALFTNLIAGNGERVDFSDIA